MEERTASEGTLTIQRFVLVSSIAGSERCLLLLPKPDICCYFLNVDSSLATTTKASNRSLDQIIPALMAFVIAIVTLLRSVKDVATKRLADKNESDEQSSAV